MNLPRRWFGLAPIGLVLGLVALPTRDDRHPAEVAGHWVDLKHTTATDTMVWILAPNGDDATLEIRIDAATGRGERQRHYGRWRLEGALADTARRQLCFVHRPGRGGGSCIRFRLDTLTGEGGSRRHLVLLQYPGEHHTEDRQLIERLIGR